MLTVAPPASFNGNAPSQVTYVWSAPGTSGGSVTASASNVTIPVSGLVNGQSYVFSVTAQSGVTGAGTSAPTTSNTVVPYGAPSIQSLTAHPADGSVGFTWSNNGNGRSITSVLVYINGSLVNAGSNPSSYTAANLGSAQTVTIRVTIATSGTDSSRSTGEASTSGTSNTTQGTYWVTQSGTSLIYHWSNVAANRWPTVTRFRCWDTPPQTQSGSIDHVGADTLGGITPGSGSVAIACNSGTNGNYSIEPWTDGPWLQNGHSITEP